MLLFNCAFFSQSLWSNGYHAGLVINRLGVRISVLSVRIPVSWGFFFTFSRTQCTAVKTSWVWTLWVKMFVISGIRTHSPVFFVWICWFKLYFKLTLAENSSTGCTSLNVPFLTGLRGLVVMVQDLRSEGQEFEPPSDKAWVFCFEVF